MATPNTLGLDLETRYEPTDIEQNTFDILAAYLPTDSSITPQQAANQINSFFPYNRSEEEEDKESGGNFLGELWEVLFRLGPQLDYREQPMQRYIALHKALQDLPGIIIHDTDIINGCRAWQDRPLFGVELYEKWSSMPFGQEADDKHNQHWKNMNGLLAHFTNQGVCECTYEALSSITRSLEDDDRKERKFIINLLVPAAAIWFVVSGRKIYEACQKHDCNDKELGEKLWKGNPQRGYSIARWEFWRSRFEVLSMHSLATEETEQVCKAAMDAMDAVTKDAS